MLERIEYVLLDGKYTLIWDPGPPSRLSCLRYGEKWPAMDSQLCGNNLALETLLELDRLRSELARQQQRSELEAMVLAKAKLLREEQLRLRPRPDEAPLDEAERLRRIEDLASVKHQLSAATDRLLALDKQPRA